MKCVNSATPDGNAKQEAKKPAKKEAKKQEA